VLVAAFAVLNSAVVEIPLLIWSFAAPRVFVVLTLLIIDFFIGLIGF
jgi:uncharacterized integral membrane protein